MQMLSWTANHPQAACTHHTIEKTMQAYSGSFDKGGITGMVGF